MVNAGLRLLNNVLGVYVVQFPCFLPVLVSRVWDIFSGIDPCLSLARASQSTFINT
jgi:hypothetical protein